MVFSATFNIMSAISWLSVLMVEETGVPGKNHDLPQIPDKLYQIILHRVHIVMSGIRARNLGNEMH
jgi:hypothetical protein